MATKSSKAKGTAGAAQIDNGSNPNSVKIDTETLNHLEGWARDYRKELKEAFDKMFAALDRLEM